MQVPLIAQVAIAGAVSFGGVFILATSPGTPLMASLTHNQSCDIKGNISINSGERIYHMPGQEFYDATIIRPEYDERWFCSEAEARAAGWRKANR